MIETKEIILKLKETSNNSPGVKINAAGLLAAELERMMENASTEAERRSLMEAIRSMEK